MKLAICDSDAKSREDYLRLVTSLAEKKGMDIDIAEYESGKQLEFALAGPEDPPDIILLEVLMPGKDGIEVGRVIRKNGYVGIIIYLSQTPDYMLPAFDVGAFNYVLKAPDTDTAGRFEQVFVSAAEKAQLYKKRYILLNGISEHRNLDIESILYFESFKHAITVHYGANETFEFISSLNHVEDLLTAFGFVRVHRSFLVNSAAIRSFDFKNLRLTDGTVLPVGRKRYPELKEVMRRSAAVDLDVKQ